MVSMRLGLETCADTLHRRSRMVTAESGLRVYANRWTPQLTYESLRTLEAATSLERYM